MQLFSKINSRNKRIYDIIFLTGAFKFHENLKSDNLQNNYLLKLIEYANKNKIVLLIQIHPRDNNDYSQYENEYIRTSKANLHKNINESKLCLSLYSTATYESLILGTLSYFVGSKLSNNWPERELIIEVSQIGQILNLSSKEYKNILLKNQNLALATFLLIHQNVSN